MIFFGEQIEIRVDRRFVFLFFCAAVLWTILIFFLGMNLSKEGCPRPVEQRLASLGWLDQQAFAAQAMQRCQESQRQDPPKTAKTVGAKASLSQQVPAAAAPSASTPSAASPSAATPSAASPSDVAPSNSAPGVPTLPRQRLSPPKPKGREKANAPSKKASDEASEEAEDSEKKPALVPKPREDQAPPDKATHTFLVLASKDLSEIAKLRKTLQSRGYKPTLLPYEHPKQGKLYHLTVGRFPDLSSAMHFSRKFREREALPGRIKSLR